MELEAVVGERREAVKVVTINRPPARNAVDRPGSRQPVGDELNDLLHALSRGFVRVLERRGLLIADSHQLQLELHSPGGEQSIPERSQSNSTWRQE